MRVYPSTNLWNFYTNNRLFIPLQYTTWLKSPRRPPIWYTYLVEPWNMVFWNYIDVEFGTRMFKLLR